MENKYKKRILFVGMPDMAIACLAKLIADGFNIVGVVPPHCSSETHDFMCTFARGFQLPVITYEKRLDEIDFIHKIRQLKADLGIVCSYNKKLPIELLKSTKDGFVNCHPSLLPEYRGGNPYSHVLINDEKETGITLHFMDEEFDTGNIIMQKKVSISETETMGTLFSKMNYLCADFISEFLSQYENNCEIPSYPQPVGDFKTALSIDAKKGNNIIDWNKDAKYIERYIRALNPFISAMTSFRGVFIKVYSAEYTNKKTKYAPGTICGNKDVLSVATGNGILHIKVLQFGSYMISDSKGFIQKFKPQIGETLGY